MKRLALALLAISSLASAQTAKPRLVVVISIDQFRHDYLHRFDADYLPARSGGKVGGFRFLTEGGADYADAHHGHIPTATGPGHCALLTGAAPSLHGIIGNDWLDRNTGKTVYCVDDPTVETIGGSTKPMSARNQLTTTVGDELKLATGGKAKVVGIALKDRGSILMAGHAADTVIWFDNGAQGWVSSTYYFPNKTLPAWVQKINGEKIPGSAVGKTWNPLLPTERYSLTRKAPFVKPTDPFPFSRPIKNMGDFWTSPYGISFTIETAKRALTEEALGQDEVPDLLAISLSSNDYVGHAYGPNSPEAMDISLAADRQLSDLFNTIDQKVGLKRTLIVLSADHGVMPIPEEGKASRLPMERLSMSAVLKTVREGLSKQFGEGDWVYGIAEQYMFLNTQTIEAKKADRDAVAKAAADILQSQPGVYVALTKSQIMAGQLPQTNWANLVTRSFNPTLSGDVMVLEKPGALFSGGTGTSHGSPWEFDSHIPIVFWGANVTPGLYGRRVYTQDIASTICTILGIEYPTGNMGTPLLELLKK